MFQVNPNFGHYPIFRIFPDMFGFFRYFTMIILGSGWQLLQKVPSINAKKLNIWLKTSKNSDVPRNNRKYLEIPSNTRKYPTVKSIPENTRSYISRLLPDPNPTRYLVFFPISDLISKNPDFFSISSASNAKKPLRLDQPFQNNLITTDFPCRAFWISMPLIDAQNILYTGIKALYWPFTTKYQAHWCKAANLRIGIYNGEMVFNR